MVVSLIEEDIFVPMGFSIVDVAERTHLAICCMY
jgi:hypothetical protein